MINYCKKCVMPSTKPDLSFEDGICNACLNFENRKKIDFKSREIELRKIFDKYRKKNGENFDCIIPVSGGKDSTWQVLQALKYEMNPLCVCSRTCDLSEIGRKNLDNIRSLGVDLIEVAPNADVRKKLNKIGLLELGDISWPEHVGIFTIPVQIAVNYKIPLIIWGENSQDEYGGPANSNKSKILDRSWLEEFGGLLGMRVSDLYAFEGIKYKDLIHYRYPEDEELKQVGVTGIFLGYFLPWDGLTNALVAQANGFKTHYERVEGSLVNYENLDNYHTGIHDYFKFLKFGFGRATDIICMQIRRNRITREEGIELVSKLDGKFPWSYLGKSLEKILNPLNISIDEFVDCCDKFTNKNIFMRENNGTLIKDKFGNLERKYKPINLKIEEEKIELDTKIVDINVEKNGSWNS